jgi:hypothetical protein
MPPGRRSVPGCRRSWPAPGTAWGSRAWRQQGRPQPRRCTRSSRARCPWRHRRRQRRQRRRRSSRAAARAAARAATETARTWLAQPPSPASCGCRRLWQHSRRRRRRSSSSSKCRRRCCSTWLSAAAIQSGSCSRPASGRLPRHPLRPPSALRQVRGRRQWRSRTVPSCPSSKRGRRPAAAPARSSRRARPRPEAWSVRLISQGVSPWRAPRGRGRWSRCRRLPCRRASPGQPRRGRRRSSWPSGRGSWPPRGTARWARC